MAGFQSVAAELAQMGDAIKMPAATSMNNAITVPDNAMPVIPPIITNGTISSMPMFQDQNFTQSELLVLPTPAIQTLSPAFEVFTTSNQILSLDNAYMEFRAQINTWPGFTYTNIVDFNGTDGDGFIWPAGGFWSLVQNLTVQLNGVPLPNYQSGNVLQQLYTHVSQHPMTFSGDVAYAYNTSVKSKQGAMGVDQFFNRPMQSQVKPFLDFSGYTNTAATSTVGQTVYFQVPLKHIWTFYQQAGRMFTNDASLRFNFVLSSLTLTGTQYKASPQTFYGNETDLGGAVFNMNVNSQPISITITDMMLVFPLYNTKSQLNDEITAIVAETPLSMTMANTEVYIDNQLTAKDMTLAASWGIGPLRTLVKGSGYLPHHWFVSPFVTVTWLPQNTATPALACNPFGVAGLGWTRSVFMPGLAYARRIYLGGQPYYDDMVLSQFGVSTVLGAINGYTQAVEKRTRALQQQGNYLDAPDQMWLNGYANATQLAPAFASVMDANFYLQYTNLNPSKSLAGVKLGSWAMGVGPNGMSLSQDPSLDTLIDSRAQSFEVETFIMPPWGPLQGVAFTGPNNEANGPSPSNVFFIGVDSVWTQSTTTGGVPIAMVPSEVSMTVSHNLPYIMIVDYGRARTTQYYYAQPSQQPLSNVPM
jgi:hypothetical protein